MLSRLVSSTRIIGSRQTLKSNTLNVQNAANNSIHSAVINSHLLTGAVTATATTTTRRSTVADVNNDIANFATISALAATAHTRTFATKKSTTKTPTTTVAATEDAEIVEKKTTTKTKTKTKKDSNDKDTTTTDSKATAAASKKTTKSKDTSSKTKEKNDTQSSLSSSSSSPSTTNTENNTSTSVKIANSTVVELKLSIVAIHENKTLVDNETITYLHGHDDFVLGLQEHLVNKSVGDKFDLVLPPEKAFGEDQQDKEELMMIKRQDFPENIQHQIKVGFGFMAAPEEQQQQQQQQQQQSQDDALQNEAGLPLIVRKVEGDKIYVAVVHPFVGLTVRVVGEVTHVRNALPQELQHGHSHGTHGHSH